MGKISQSEKVEEHIELICDCLKGIHKKKPNPQWFLSGAHLKLFYKHLRPLNKFVKLLPMYKDQYEAVKEFVHKIAGGEEPQIVSSFLRSLFPSLRARKLSWSLIFEEVDQLAIEVSSTSSSYLMKKLLDRFTNGKAIEFFCNMYAEVAETQILNHEVSQDLKKLCNHVVELRKQRKSNEHLLNFRRNVVSCFVPTFNLKQLVKAG